MPDVHVICDAPIGCFNLVGTAVPDYTDAIPHIENLTPATMTEQEVGGKGTGPTVVRTWEGLRDSGVLDGKRLIVVSTAESEMIGADHQALVGTLTPGTLFYYSNSLAEDEWAGRDRVLRWLWEHYGHTSRGGDQEPEPTAPRPPISDPALLVNIIGPTYGCFNAPSDLHELKRLIAGAGGELNLVYPYEARLADTPRLAAGAVNVVMYREFGAGLAGELGRPMLYAPFGMRGTTEFVRELGRLLGTEAQAEAFIQAEKRSTLQPLWDLWRGPQSDWFATSGVGISGGRSYADGLASFLGEELGMPVHYVSGRPLRRDEPGNEQVREMLHKAAPAFVFGSINEKIYLSEAGARFTHFLPAGFPLPIVRRALGTPFMGYSGAVYLVQEIVNRLYEALFNFMPLDGAYARGGAQPAGSAAAVRWQPQAKALLDAELEKLPFIPRISASRNLQMQAEALAQQQGVAEITPEVVETALAQSRA